MLIQYLRRTAPLTDLDPLIEAFEAFITSDSGKSHLSWFGGDHHRLNVLNVFLAGAEAQRVINGGKP